MYYFYNYAILTHMDSSMLSSDSGKRVLEMHLKLLVIGMYPNLHASP